jgi:hypothetical protein
MRDENDFFDKINDHIENNKHFSFGCDSCTIVEEFFLKMKENKTKEQLDKMILFTASSKFPITNASEQFKDRFLFYSPAIETAVDITLNDKQDVFIYIRGLSIDPASSFQQATRTRNINKLYYFCEKGQ